jgi:hypothetical protein
MGVFLAFQERDKEKHLYRRYATRQDTLKKTPRNNPDVAQV